MHDRAAAIPKKFQKAEPIKIEKAIKKLEGSSHGARLEVSFVNLSKRELMEAFKTLRQIGEEMLAIHNTLTKFYLDGLIPFETLRLSPIQEISTVSLTSLASFQARLLNTMFSKLLEACSDRKFNTC